MAGAGDDRSRKGASQGADRCSLGPRDDPRASLAPCKRLRAAVEAKRIEWGPTYTAGKITGAAWCLAEAPWSSAPSLSIERCPWCGFKLPRKRGA